MRIGRAAAVAAGVLCLCAMAALAIQSGERRAADSTPVYRVTAWPTNTPDRPYREEVERYLNQMASEGWRLDSQLAAQGANMLVFEREPERDQS